MLSQTAAKRFEAYTAARIGKKAAIVLDRKIVSVAVIEGKISDMVQYLRRAQSRGSDRAGVESPGRLAARAGDGDGR